MKTLQSVLREHSKGLDKVLVTNNCGKVLFSGSIYRDAEIAICLFALKNQYVDQIEKSGTYFHVTLA